jgi:hypothetical protein
MTANIFFCDFLKTKTHQDNFNCFLFDNTGVGRVKKKSKTSRTSWIWCFVRVRRTGSGRGESSSVWSKFSTQPRTFTKRPSSKKITRIKFRFLLCNPVTSKVRTRLTRISQFISSPYPQYTGESRVWISQDCFFIVFSMLTSMIAPWFSILWK